MSQDIAIQSTNEDCVYITNFITNFSLVLGSSNRYETKKFFLNPNHGVECSVVINVEKVSHGCVSIQVELHTETLIIVEDMEISFQIENRPQTFVFKLLHDESRPLLYESVQYQFNYSSSSCRHIGNYSNFNGTFNLKNGHISYRTSMDGLFNWNSNLQYLLKYGNYSDLKITLEDDTSFQVHKLILAYKSAVLKNMIDIDMKEKKTNTINILGFDAISFQEVLNYIYCGNCDYGKDVYSIFQFAHMYQIEDLAQKCENHMINKLNVGNFVETLKLVNIEDYNLKQLKTKTDEFLKQNESKLLKNINFIDFLLENMNTNNIQYIFRLSNEYKLDILKQVKQFIFKNLKKVLENNEFVSLFKQNPEWMMEVCQYIANNISKETESAEILSKMAYNIPIKGTQPAGKLLETSD